MKGIIALLTFCIYSSIAFSQAALEMKFVKTYTSSEFITEKKIDQGLEGDDYNFEILIFSDKTTKKWLKGLYNDNKEPNSTVNFYVNGEKFDSYKEGGFNIYPKNFNYFINPDANKPLVTPYTLNLAFRIDLFIKDYPGKLKEGENLIQIEVIENGVFTSKGEIKIYNFAVKNARSLVCGDVPKQGSFKDPSYLKDAEVAYKNKYSDYKIIKVWTNQNDQLTINKNEYGIPRNKGANTFALAEDQQGNCHVLNHYASYIYDSAGNYSAVLGLYTAPNNRSADIMIDKSCKQTILDFLK